MLFRNSHEFFVTASVANLVLLLTERSTDAHGCGGSFVEHQGIITSPNYPENYSDNLDCIYFIRQLEGYRITLTFKDFHLEENCDHDFLEILDGGSPSSQRISILCGDTMPGNLRTSRNFLQMRFVSNSALTFRGFKVLYTAAVIPLELILLASPRTHSILWIDLETLTSITIPVQFIDEPMAIDYEPVDNRVYWIDKERQEIWSAFLNGTDTRLLPGWGLNTVLEDIALDATSRLLFFSDSGQGFIGLLSISAFDQNQLSIINASKPRQLALDPGNGVIFWIDLNINVKINRVNYDGSDNRAIVINDLVHPTAITLDIENGYLYWVDPGKSTVEFTNMEGQYRSTFKSPYQSHLVALAFFENQLYVVDTHNSVITNTTAVWRAVNANGTLVFTTAFLHVLGDVTDIVIYSAREKQTGPNGCGNNYGGCRHICLPLPGNSSKCTCPDRQHLAENKTCAPGSMSVSNTGYTSALIGGLVGCCLGIISVITAVYIIVHMKRKGRTPSHNIQFRKASNLVLNPSAMTAAERNTISYISFHRDSEFLPDLQETVLQPPPSASSDNGNLNLGNHTFRKSRGVPRTEPVSITLVNGSDVREDTTGNVNDSSQTDTAVEEGDVRTDQVKHPIFYCRL